MHLLDLLISPAMAQTAAPAAPAGGGLSMLFMVPLFVAMMYFMVIRPQTKRSKEHRALMDALAKGDEVLTSSGIAGVVRSIGEHFIGVEVAPGIELRIQRTAIASVLPKGTLKGA